MLHRNRRRRPFRPFGYYFITTNVSEGLALLETKLYGHLLEHVIQAAAQTNNCKIIAYKINPDHVHLIVQLGKVNTISQYMGSMKRNFSRQTNEVLLRQSRWFNSNPCQDSDHPRLKSNHPGLDSEHSGWDSNPSPMPETYFRWQPSYHSHLITSKNDFDNHIAYIEKQHIKHELSSNKFCYVDESHVFKYQ